jgi:hypothetical protein
MGFLSQPISIIPTRPVRMIGSIKVQVVIHESTNDTVTITKQPVQQGASISDHAFKEPTSLSMSIYFNDNALENLFSLSTLSNPIAALNNNNGLAKIYKSLLDLQNNLTPIDIVTPKRIYKQMMIATLAMTTDRATENCLKIDISFQQVIIVSISTVQVPRTSQKNPAATGATQAAGKKSVLLSGTQSLGNLFPGIGALFK